jgi:hypothetical protein
MEAPIAIADTDAVSQGAGGGFRAFDRLLTQPESLFGGEDGRHPSASPWLLAGGLAGFLFYGAAAGGFQGGLQILIAALKAPLIAALALALCLPSLYVFGALSGARWTRRRLLASVAGFVGTLGLLLGALLPISWLFSVSSRYLSSAVWIHVMLWLISLLFGWRFLGRALRDHGSGGGMFLWLLLFGIVSLQVATFVRPVLWRDPGQPIFESGKMFFLEHFGNVMDHDDAAARAKAEKKAKAEEKARKKEKEQEKEKKEKKEKAAPPAQLTPAPTRP